MIDPDGPRIDGGIDLGHILSRKRSVLPVLGKCHSIVNTSAGSGISFNYHGPSVVSHNNVENKFELDYNNMLHLYCKLHSPTNPDGVHQES